MCGILGYVAQRPFDLERPLSAIRHRGPDGQGQFLEESGGQYLGLGHVRLSIIDVSTAANQPFFNADNRYVIVFNGEIYNYQHLRAQYLDGETLRTTSDTEVLLQLYIRYGTDMLNWLEGMFALAIYDRQTSQLILIRDQLGIKPLYYTLAPEGFFFASEIRALQAFGIRPEVDTAVITEFLLSGFIYEPETGFANISKLPPGHFATLTLGGGVVDAPEIKAYWTPHAAKGTLPVSEAIDHTIDLHTVSDVPVGLFFSGGVDSSLILARLGNKIKSLTVRPSDADVAAAGNENDFAYAEKISRHLKVSNLDVVQFDEQQLSNETFLATIDELSGKMEELVADYTYFASSRLSHAARAKGLKVVLSGMGADELFAGYSRYKLIGYDRLLKGLGKTGIFRLLFGYLKKIPKYAKKVGRFQAFLTEREFVYAYSSIVGVFSRPQVQALLHKPFFDRFAGKLNDILQPYAKLSRLKQAQVLDLYGFLAHNFSVADKSSMEASIEMRVPLATARLFEQAMALPDNQLVHKGTTKYVLKEKLARFIPAQWVHRSKTGFNPPLDTYINNLTAEELLTFFRQRSLFTLCDEQAVKNIVADHYNGVANNTYQIFNLLFLAAWFHRFSGPQAALPTFHKNHLQNNKLSC